MTREEIERVLRLQNAVYELLLWLNKRAENEPEILSDHNLEKWRYAQSCEIWVRETYGMIPQALRPDEAEIPLFASLFSSFFQTSFHVVESAPVRAYDSYGEEAGYVGSGQRKLMAGAPGGKKSSKGKAKIAETVRELRLIALEELSLENDIFPNREALEGLGSEDEHGAALDLWAYFHELNRRAHFASQGDAVRALWLALDKKTRDKMSADDVVKARDELVAALKAL